MTGRSQFPWHRWLVLLVAAGGVRGSILEFDLIGKTTGGVVPMLTLEIGTPPQISRVQLDSGSDALVTYAPGELCESITDKFQASCILTGSETVENGNAMKGAIPKELLPDGKPLGYDNNQSTTQKTSVDFLFRLGYGSDHTGFITCSLVEEIKQRFPAVLFGPDSHDPASPYFRANIRAHNLVTKCCEPAWAKTWCYNRAWKEGDDADSCCPASPTMQLGYGGPIVRDEIKGMGMVSYIQSTRFMPKSANIGSCALPVNGIIGVSGLSQIAKSQDWRSLSVDARAGHLYLNQDPNSSNIVGELVELEVANSGRGDQNQQIWTVMITDFETSDGKVSFKKFSDAMKKYNEENKDKADFKEVNISMAYSTMLDTGDSTIKMPPFIYNAFMTAYGTDQCKWPRSLDLIFKFQKHGVGDPYEARVPLSSLLKPDSQEDCKEYHTLRPNSENWAGPFEFLGPGPQEVAWILGAPLLVSHVVKYNYRNQYVSLARSANADEAFNWAFPEVDCPVIPRPGPSPSPSPDIPMWVWILLGFGCACACLIPCAIIAKCWPKWKSHSGIAQTEPHADSDRIDAASYHLTASPLAKDRAW